MLRGGRRHRWRCRPFIWRRATALGLSGWVENESGGVIAEVQGENDTVAAFITGLATAAP
ncbi:MAG: acylphosphatase, partial [Planctomycetaceae bacterium]